MLGSFLLAALLMMSSSKTTTGFQQSTRCNGRPQQVIRQPREKDSSDSSSRLFSQSASATSVKKDSNPNRHPSLIVFDLDNTLWNPELYQLRKLQRSKQNPIAGRDVQLLSGAQVALQAIRSGQFPRTKFAVASRTKSVDWAHDLLDQFGIRDVLDFVEIFPGHKRRHFENLAAASGIQFRDMLFFDDARDGKFGNCLPVSEMGVLSVHCPAGLDTEHVFTNALQCFQDWNREPGHIVEWDGVMRNIYDNDNKEGSKAGLRQEGTVKMVNAEKRYGFIQYGDPGTKDLFFHFNNLPYGSTVEGGDKLSFQVERNPKNGKSMASNIETQKRKEASSASSSSSSVTATAAATNTISMKAFSMNQPFAALLANGYKTLETRNGTMFGRYPAGTQLLLHVGRRTYPDGDKHMQVMKSGGLSDQEIEQLKSLPAGFGRGMAVAILEIGETYETTIRERSDPDFERKVAAFGSDSGRMVTEIRRVQYLKRPVRVSGQGGVFPVPNLDPDVLPDGWTVPQTTTTTTTTMTSRQPQQRAAGGTAAKNGEKKPLYSISG